MRWKRWLYRAVCFCLLLGMNFSAWAWNHGISVGYGGGADPNHSQFTNSGVFISGEFASLKKKSWLSLTFNGAVGEWFSTTPAHKNLTTVAASIASRFYIWHSAKFHPFILASVGPSYLSNKKFGHNTQGSHFSFQSILGVGFELGQQKRLDINLRFVHYSNANLIKPNEGYNIFYVVSVGYLFG